jgi:hypothetical protein
LLRHGEGGPACNPSQARRVWGAERLVERSPPNGAHISEGLNIMNHSSRYVVLAGAAGAAVVAGVALNPGAADAIAGTRAATSPTVTGRLVATDAHGDMPHGADIWKVTVGHRKQVTVDIRHADLVRSYKSGSSGSVFLDTDPARRGPEYVFTGGFYEGADYQLARADGWKEVGSPINLRCSYVMKLDYARDVTHIAIGRGCLGKPAKVRVAVRTGGEQPDGTIVRDWLHRPRSFTRWVARA